MNGIDFDPRPSMALFLAGPDLEVRKPARKTQVPRSDTRRTDAASARSTRHVVWRWVYSGFARLT